MIGFQELWNRWAGVPFEFGTFDCVILSAWWLDQRTGSSHSEWLKALGYHDGRSALRLVRQAGGLRTGVSAHLGPSTSDLLDGDIGLMNLGHGKRTEVLGILAPQQVLIAGAHGVIALPFRHLVTEGWPCRKR